MSDFPHVPASAAAEPDFSRLCDAVDARFGAVASLGPIAAAPHNAGRFDAQRIIGRTAESALMCRQCGSKQVDYTLVQRRSADEAMTALAVCQKCGARWSEG